MSSSFFYLHAEPSQVNSEWISDLNLYANENSKQVYVLDKPLGDNKYSYEDYPEFLILLIPKHKIMILNFSDDNDAFEDLVEDFIEDLGSISDKYQYKNTIGRPRKWRDSLIFSTNQTLKGKEVNVKQFIEDNYLNDVSLHRKSELLISLLTGSINDIDRVKSEVSTHILDKIKQKIILFDGEQTRFIYQNMDTPKITIQGLSGTGKTELLLHKLKDIYLNQEDSRVLFTCHNKILAASLRDRIPKFFNFMKVEKQIEWNERLWCIHAWGGRSDYNSGAYRYICHKYGIAFQPFSYSMPFSKACLLAIKHLNGLDIESIGYAFDYVLIDESQDFPKEFIELCSLVTKSSIFVAGDIFQSIFDENIVSEVKPDFLLSNCYRTDPRTLMFAHALGMGLFEKNKLRWLNDNEWNACGYTIIKSEDETEYLLKREPLRRFEDLDFEDIQSMKILRTNDLVEDQNTENIILNVIQNIIQDNPTVTPNDIGIVFTGGNKRGFLLADKLEYLIPKQFGWGLNKAYESKMPSDDKVFFSNKNNVKGLEFPFVICVSDYISDLPNERNALYMLLTRSFIQTYLLVSGNYEPEKIERIEIGLEYINTNGEIKVTAPTDAEKKKITTTIDFDINQQSVHELIYSIFDELNVPPLWIDPIYGLLKKIDPEKASYDILKDLIITNLEKMGVDI